jgi:hypothetical protein
MGGGETPPGKEPQMAFEVFEVAVQMVGALREPLGVLERKDPDLARQVRRATASSRCSGG